MSTPSPGDGNAGTPASTPDPNSSPKPPGSVDPADPKPENSAQPKDDSGDEPTTESGSGSSFVRREIAAAATYPGGTAAKRHQRDESQRRLGVTAASRTDFHGWVSADTVVGRDQVHNNYYAEAPDPHGHFEITTTRAEARARYVAPARFDELVSFCRDRPIAVIRVVTGQGRAATALRLLHEVCDGTLFRLEPATGMSGLRGKNIAERGGYLLTGVTQEQADGLLTKHEMERLTTELRHRSARLVVTVSDQLRLTHLGAAEYVTYVDERADPRAVFDRHLAGRLDAGEIRRLVEDPAMIALLQAECGPNAELRQVAWLAAVTADLARTERREAVADAVRRRLANTTEQEFTRWFQGLGNLSEHSFVIALAVLNGMPYETVAQAARVLETRLAAPMNGRLEDLPRDQIRPFGISRSARLQQLRARVTTTATTTPYGEVPAEGVEFDDANRAQQVLFYAWREYDQAHTALVSWLRVLGGHAVEEVRTRAGVAVGALCRVAFDFLRHSVIEPWAAATDATLRETAAIALNAAYATPELEEIVRQLVHEWSIDGARELVATAVRAYGGSIGADQPARVFATFGENADDDDFSVTFAVCMSLTELADAGRDGISDRALLVTRSWAASRTRGRRLTGNLAFLMMAADLLWSAEGSVVRPTRTARAGHWPLVLRLTRLSPEWLGAIAEMWAAALASNDAAEVAIEVLDGWAEAAENDQPCRDQLVSVLAAVCARSTRARGRLGRRAAEWAGSDGGTRAPRTAASLHATNCFGLTRALPGATPVRSR